jgi:hypothetical protein
VPTQLTPQRLVDYLESQEIPHETDQLEDGIITFGIEGDHGAYDMAFDLDPEAGLLVCMTQLSPPLEIGPEHVARICEAVCRINGALPLGGFRFDPGDRVLTYLCGACVEDADLVEAQITALVMEPVEEFERYLPALREILGGAEVGPTIARAEEAEEQTG